MVNWAGDFIAVSTYVEFECLCIIILTLLLYVINKIKNKNERLSLVFVRLLFAVSTLIILTDMIWAISEYNSFNIRWFLYFDNCAYFVFDIIAAFLYFCYGEINRPSFKKFNKVKFFGAALPVICMLILIIASIKGGYIFYIDENNIYHRGNCYYIYISVKFAYYVIMIVRTFISAIKTKIKAERIIFISLIFAGLIYVTSFSLRLIYYIGFDCEGLAIGLAVIYIFVIRDYENKRYNLNLGIATIVEEFMADYHLVFFVNTVSEKMTFFKGGDYITGDLLNASKEGYSSFMARYIEGYVEPLERQRFTERTSLSYILKELNSETSVYYNTFLTKFVTNEERYYRFKAIRYSKDPKGQTIIIGGRNVDKEIRNELQIKKQLEEARDRAEKASIAKSEFLSMMSHDIRTPLNGVVGMTDIAYRNLDNKEKLTDCLDKIKNASHHLLSLINDVLDMTKIESGKTEYVHDPFDVELLIDNCVSIAIGQVAERDLEIVKNIENVTHPHLFGDELHLRQIFLNIIGNAIKFTGDGGKIYVRVKEIRNDAETATIKFEIEDTGIGMSEEFIAHIFEAFTQEENGSRTSYQGTGLGMAITKRLVEIMGGNIEVYSKKDVGSKFDITIPFDINYDYKEGEKSTEIMKSIEGAHILLAEDNELNAEIACELLSYEGAIIDLARNGLEAYEMYVAAENRRYDAILMDIRMPEMDGIEATKLIRGSGKDDSLTVPIIAMTANAFEEDIKKSKEAGMNAHLTKPVDVKNLVRVLSRNIWI